MMKLGANVAIFLLFFGIALIEAMQARRWWLATLFALLGVVFLVADKKLRS